MAHMPLICLEFIKEKEKECYLMLLRNSIGTEPYIVGQMPIKGKKNLGHQIFRRFTFIFSLKELSAKINQCIFSDKNDCWGDTEKQHLLRAKVEQSKYSTYVTSFSQTSFIL
jgi:hypothetical protein